MAKIILNIPDKFATRVQDGLCGAYGYDGTGTKLQFIQKLLIGMIRSAVVRYEARIASQEAQSIAEESMTTADLIGE